MIWPQTKEGRHPTRKILYTVVCIYTAYIHTYIHTYIHSSHRRSDELDPPLSSSKIGDVCMYVCMRIQNRLGRWRPRDEMTGQPTSMVWKSDRAAHSRYPYIHTYILCNILYESETAGRPIRLSRSSNLYIHSILNP